MLLSERLHQLTASSKILRKRIIDGQQDTAVTLSGTRRVLNHFYVRDKELSEVLSDDPQRAYALLTQQDTIQQFLWRDTASHQLFGELTDSAERYQLIVLARLELPVFKQSIKVRAGPKEFNGRFVPVYSVAWSWPVID